MFSNYEKETWSPYLFLLAGAFCQVIIANENLFLPGKINNLKINLKLKKNKVLLSLLQFEIN